MIICDACRASEPESAEPAQWLLFRRGAIVKGRFPLTPAGAACTPHLGYTAEAVVRAYGADRIEVHRHN